MPTTYFDNKLFINILEVIIYKNYSDMVHKFKDL